LSLEETIAAGFQSVKSSATSSAPKPSAFANASVSESPAVSDIRKRLPESYIAAAIHSAGTRLINFPVNAANSDSTLLITS